MTARKYNFILKELRCKKCGNKQIISRKESKNKPFEHIKHIWCHICQKRNPHKEIDRIY